MSLVWRGVAITSTIVFVIIAPAIICMLVKAVRPCVSIGDIDVIDLYGNTVMTVGYVACREGTIVFKLYVEEGGSYRLIDRYVTSSTGGKALLYAVPYNTPYSTISRPVTYLLKVFHDGKLDSTIYIKVRGVRPMIRLEGLSIEPLGNVTRINMTIRVWNLGDAPLYPLAVDAKLDELGLHCTIYTEKVVIRPRDYTLITIPCMYNGSLSGIETVRACITIWTRGYFAESYTSELKINISAPPA